MDAEGLFDEVEVGFVHDEVLGDRFRGPSWGFGSGVSRGLGGFLRTEPNFRLFPFFLGLYELVVSAVEGPVGGGVVADKESEALGDTEFGGLPGSAMKAMPWRRKARRQSH